MTNHLFGTLLRLFLERAGHEPADLVITDLSMPNMTGFEMMAAMKLKFGTVKMFVVSGRGDAELQKRKVHGRNGRLAEAL